MRASLCRKPGSLRDCADVAGLTLYDADLMAILGLGKSAFYPRKKSGLYRFLEVRPQLGGRTQYSGELVQRWRNGAGRSQGFSLRPVGQRASR